jgi:hypothetical protein
MTDLSKQALPIGALLTAGAVALVAGPKLASLGRKAVHRATGVPFRSHTPTPGPAQRRPGARDRDLKREAWPW